MANRFTESAVLAVIDESSKPVDAINRALSRLEKTAQKLAKAAVFSPQAGQAAARNMAAMATTADRIGKALGGVRINTAGVGTSVAKATTGLTQLQKVLADINRGNTSSASGGRNGFATAQRSAQVAASQIRAAQQFVAREYSEGLRRVGLTTAEAHRKASEQVISNARTTADNVRRAGQIVEEANAAQRRIVAPPPPNPNESRAAYAARLRAYEDRRRQLAAAGGVPPITARPRALAQLAQRPLSRTGGPLTAASLANALNRAAVRAPSANVLALISRRPEDEKRQQQNAGAAGAATGAVIAGAVKKMSAVERRDAGNRVVEAVHGRAVARLEKAEIALSTARLTAAKQAEILQRHEVRHGNLLEKALSTNRKDDMARADKLAGQNADRQKRLERAHARIGEEEKEFASAQTLVAAAKDTKGLATDRVQRRFERDQAQEVKERGPSVGQRVLEGARNTMKYAAQGVAMNAVTTAMHDGWEGAKEISSTRAAMDRLAWTPEQKSLATRVSEAQVRKYGTLTQGEAEQMFREVSSTQHSPEEAAKIMPLFAKAFQDQVQAGGDRHTAGQNITRLIKASEMANVLVDREGHATPERAKEFLDTVTKAQAIEGARMLDARHIMNYVKYSRTAGTAQDEDGRLRALFLAAEEGGSSGGVLVNALTRGFTGRAYEYARANLVRGGLATGDIVRNKSGKERVENFALKNEEEFRINQWEWARKFLLGPDGALAQAGVDHHSNAAVASWAQRVTSSQTGADALVKLIQQFAEMDTKVANAKKANISDKQSSNAGRTDLNVATEELKSSIVTATQRASEAIPIAAPVAHIIAGLINRASEIVDWRRTVSGDIAPARHASRTGEQIVGTGTGLAVLGAVGLAKLVSDNPVVTAQLGAAAALTGAAGALTGAAGAISIGGLARGAVGVATRVAGAAAVAGAVVYGITEAERAEAERRRAMRESGIRGEEESTPELTAWRQAIAGAAARRTADIEHSRNIVTLAERLGIDGEIDDNEMARRRGSMGMTATSDVRAWLDSVPRSHSLWSNIVSPAYAASERGPASRYADLIAGMDENEMARRNGAAGIKPGADAFLEAGQTVASLLAEAMTPIGEQISAAGEYAGLSIENAGKSAADVLQAAIEAGASAGASMFADALASASVSVSGPRPDTGSNAGFVR